MSTKLDLSPRVLKELAEMIGAGTQQEGMSRDPGFLRAHEAELMARLAELGGRGVQQEDIAFEGTRFVIPATISLKEAVTFLAQRLEQEDKATTYHRTFMYRQWDGAHATQAALRKAFGAMGAKSTFSMFGERPPQLHSINIGPHEQTQVPWGVLTLPVLPGASIYLDRTRHPEFGWLFQVTVEAPRKFRHEIEGIFKLIEQELVTASIYKGKAIDGKEMPDFLDLGGLDPKQVVYADETIAQLDANVWSLLEHTEVMESLGVPLKRSVLLEGPYGTGKTLAAYLTAQKAVANGWTFLMCRPGRDSFAEVMQTARLYQPAVVFFEDVDVISGGDSEKDGVSELLDLFDGIGAKGTQLLCVLTTNHAEKIHKGMVRPGRLDAVIHIGALDRGGVERMVDAIIPADLLDPDINYDAVWESMQGFLPAFVKEAIDRALRYAIARTGGKPDRLTTSDFVTSAKGLRPQLELMEGAREGKDRDPMSSAVEKAVRAALNGVVVLDSDEDQWGSLSAASNGH